MQVTLQRRLSGRLAGRRCVVGGAAPRRGARCVAWRAVSAGTVRAGKGAATVVVVRRGQRLAAGRYRVLVRATDGAGNRSAQVRAGLRIGR